MAKKLQLKPQHGRLIVKGIGEVTNDNITTELYEKLLAISPGHAELFHEVEVPEPKIKFKPTKSE